MVQRVDVSRTNRTTRPEDASVVLTVPAHKDYITIVRSAVAQLCACFEFTVGEISDLRLAVDEACNLLVGNRVPAWPAGDLECRAEVRGDLVHVLVIAPVGNAEPPDTEGFGWKVLTALVDTLAWEQDRVTVRVELEKRRGVRGG